MRPRRRSSRSLLAAALFAFIGIPGLSTARAEEASSSVKWRAFSESVFADAAREKKLVLVDLEAVWCHWCHVMDAKTYGDPAVAALVAKHYVAVKVDQDAHPDLSRRWEDWGWPATVILGADGKELGIRSGYIEAPDMLKLLDAFAKDPTPGPSVAALRRMQSVAPAAEVFPSALRGELEKMWREQYDEKLGSWGFSHKFLEWNGVELALRRAAKGDEAAARMARQTLAAQRALLDPAWGGMYQYSAGGTWDEPHFEKLVSIQAYDLRVYSLAFALWREPAHREVAREIHRYLTTFLLREDGAFGVSQDADLVPGEHAADYFALDDAGRRARGIPRVDRSGYARENGWVIDALVAYHVATGNAEALREAERAAAWVVAHRAAPGGGFRHGEKGPAYLGDTASMAQAFLALFEATQDPAWKKRAADAVAAIPRKFRVAGRPGFVSAPAGSAARLGSLPNRDENVLVVRVASRFHRLTADPGALETARDAARYLSARPVATAWPAAAALLAAEELPRAEAPRAAAR